MWTLCLGVLSCSCEDEPEGGSVADGSGAASATITPEMRQRVLATVGSRQITLGDYIATLERMDQFERLRYQSPARRRKLLEEIIEVELLAQEAKRRSLDERPDTREQLRQVLRDELLRRVRADLPEPAELPIAQVRAYYDEHRKDFREPERRRVAHIEIAGQAAAEKVLAEASRATDAEWGQLVKRHSLDRPESGVSAPAELAGDLGIVSAPGSDRGDNPNIAEPLRRAAFAIEDVGDVYPELVQHGNRWHIVRLTGRTPARDRGFEEAERTIRLRLLQERAREAESKLEQELRARYPVQVDQQALARVKVPPVSKPDG